MSDASEPFAAPRVPHRPWLAALLSFAFPGLGQAYAGRRRLALLLAVPVALLVLVVAGVATGFLGQLRSGLFASDVLTGILIGNGILLAWRGVAIAEAGLSPWSSMAPHDRRLAIASVTLLLALATGMHVWVGGVVTQLNATLAQVFAPDTNPAPDGGGNNGLVEATPSAEPVPAWNGTDRINILLLGTDAAPGREVALTDVVLVVSVDPASHTAVMISIPRDTGYLPLPDRAIFPDALYPDKVNSIMPRAAAHAEAWCPDLANRPTACGIRIVEAAVGLYLGIEIHHHALVDMAGFAEVIDAIGGVDLCLPGRLVDPTFDSAISQRYTHGLELQAGCRRYDGEDALAYARSRKGWIEMPDGTIVGQSDFDRAERQQKVLLAMRNELSQADTLLELPDLLRAVAHTVSTDVPREQAAGMASLLPLITGPDIERVVLGYPDFVEAPLNPDVNYLLIPRRDAIRERMAAIFGGENLVGWYLGTGDTGPDGPQAGASTVPAP